MSNKSDFAAAEQITAILKAREKVEQERILRWVIESLNLTVSVASGTATPAGLTSTLPPGPPQVAQLTTTAAITNVKSFAEEKQPKSDIQWAAVIAYFYHFNAPPTERKDSVTSGDLNEASRKARGFAFKKASDTLNNAMKAGYFDKAGHGHFKLNAVGENLVAMTLPGSDAPDGNQPRRLRPKRRKKLKGIRRKE